MLGWKEYEMEVVRDKKDNCIIICSIENIDPMGVHTGDSITVAPALTLTDKEYQIMRDASMAVLREIGVETGGSNVQFGINPADGRMVVIEMNPRVSRSSALASKATGFPIAKVAARLAVGYTLDELDNDITGGMTPASLRAHHRLCRHQDPAFRLRKIPRRRQSPDHLDEVGRRSHGHRPHLPGNRCKRPCARSKPASPASTKSAFRAWAKAKTTTPSRPPSAPPRPIACCTSPKPCGWACRSKTSTKPARSIPGSSSRCRASSTWKPRCASSACPTTPPALRCLKAMGFSDKRLAELPASSPPTCASCAIRSPSARSISASTPPPPNSPRPPPICTRPMKPPFAGAVRRRGAPLRPQEGRHPRRRSQPHRPGHRVRLLLLPCRLRAQRSRL